MNARIDALRARMDREGLDAVLLTGCPSVRYFTGFTSAEAYGLVTGKGLYFFTDFRYTIQAKQEAPGWEITEFAAGHGLKECVSEKLTADGAKSVGFEEKTMLVSMFRMLESLPFAFKPFSDALAELRLLKTAEEAEYIQRAQDMADASFEKLLGRIHPGMTEKQVAAELTYLGAMEGSEGPSFDPIVGSGPNGAMCHAVPSDRQLQEGDLVVFDFGCIYKGYHSDMTRTVAVGEISDVCRKIYGIVLEAHEKALHALRPGVTGSGLHAIAADVIEAAGYGDCFGHGLGHGVGLEIHEGPNASPRSNATFEPGMTITVEPGIYVEGLCGVRIEDCCIVTPEGYRDFVRTPKELLTIR